jgi:tRNA threonylcarbamoyl adenosine modification protein YeaZ
VGTGRFDHRLGAAGREAEEDDRLDLLQRLGRPRPRSLPIVLLAFDTATPYVSVALHDGEDVVAEARSEERMKHGEQLAPLIDDLLTRAGVVRQDLTALAVGTGPGPFTGLRVGLVTARTLSFVLEIPAYGGCSRDAIALEATAGLGGTTDFVVATDARRKEVYLAVYDEQGTRLSGPVVDKPGNVTTDLPVAGEGAVLYPEAFPRAVSPEMPSAAWLALAVVEERVELTDPEPRYLRRPDAVAWRDRVSTSSTTEKA